MSVKILSSIVFLLVLFSCVSISAQVTNDSCASASPLGTLPSPAVCGAGIQSGTAVLVAGTNVNATPENPYVSLSGCGMASPANSVWYYFVSPVRGYGVKIIVSGGTLANPNIALWSGAICDSLSGISCIVGSANTATLTVNNGIIPGQTYYIQISGNTGESGTFNLSVNAFQDCSDCLNASSIIATPPPVNGTYQPGQSVSFCFHVDQWTQTTNNWLHGVQLAFGPGWNTSSLVATPPAPFLSTAAVWGGGTPATCGYWQYYPSGITSSANGTSWPAGFYFNGTYNTVFGFPSSCGSAADGNPGNNFGDGVSDPTLVVTPTANDWNFCWTIDVLSGCNPGMSLSVAVNTSGDGESGAWANPGCANDPATNFSAMISCCPPNMSSTPTCTGLSAGTATASPVGTAGPYTYIWSFGNTNAATITGLPAGPYTVTVVDANLCTSTASVTVTNGSSPVSNAGAPVSICSGATGNLGATPTAGYTYAWSPSTGLSSSTAANPTVTLTNVTVNPVTTTYTVTTTNTGTGCSSTASVNVTVNPLPTPTATNTGPYCISSSIQLNSSAAVSYTWNGPVAFSSNTQNPTRPNATVPMAGTYTVTVTDANNCTAAASTTVLVNSSFALTASNTGPYCVGNTIQLNATPGTTFSWSGPNSFTNSSQVASIAAATTVMAGSYTVTATDANGCSGTANTNVVVNPLPVPSASNTGPYCEGASIQLGALGGTGYAWAGPLAYTNNAQTPSIANITTAMSGVYNVTVTDANGCSAATSTSVLVNAAPVAAAGSDGLITCTVLQTTLNAAPVPSGGTYNWSGPGILSGSNTAAPVVNAAGNYILLVTDANNCTASDVASVILNTTPPNANAGADAVLTCTVTIIPLNASSTTAGVSFAWNNGVTSSANTVTIVNTYVVTVTDPINGCTASDAVIVSIDTTTPNASAGPDKVLPCIGGVNLDGTSTEVNAVFSWSGPAITSGANTATPQVNSTGTYTLLITNPANGCTASDVANVTPAVPPAISATITDNPCAQIAIGQITLQVNGGLSPFTYLWSNNAITQNIFGLRGGTYNVTTTDAYGCSVSASYLLNEGSYNVDAQVSATVNLGDSVELTGIVTGGTGQETYNWTPDYHLSCAACKSPLATPYVTTVYTLQATDTNGCYGYDTVTITVFPLHDIFIPNAFTPNGDGNNDFFSIYGKLNLLVFFEARIFDRWGEKVFESNNPYFTWDGTYLGVAETPGVFVYTMKATFIDGYSRTDYKGSITLIK